VVVLAARVAGNLRVSAASASLRVLRVVRVVDDAQGDDRSRRPQDLRRVESFVARCVQVAHVAGAALIEPLAQPRQLGMPVGARDAAQIETTFAGVVFDRGGGQHAAHGLWLTAYGLRLTA